MTSHFIAAAALCLWAGAAQADVALPSGARWDLAGGSIALGGGEWRNGGQLTLGAGTLDGVGVLRIDAGGQIDADSGLLRVAGDWSNAGQFLAGASRVEFLDGGSGGVVSGSTLFHDATFASSTGRRWSFAAGSTQSFDGRLTIQGVTGLPIQLASTAPGQVAYFDLKPGGTQDIHLVGVSDIHAIGQHLAPDQTNQGGSGNDSGWFGALLAALVPVPALSPLGVGVLSVLLFLLARRRLRARAASLP